MRRLPFLLYCLACWEYFLFEPLVSINLLCFGFWFVLARREWQALKAARETQGGARCSSA
jgi:hypothetical protein